MEDKNLLERIAIIETNIKHIGEFIEDIKDNHLPSIYSRFTCMEKKIANRLPGWATILITFFSSLAVGLIVYAIIKK